MNVSINLHRIRREIKTQKSLSRYSMATRYPEKDIKFHVHGPKWLLIRQRKALRSTSICIAEHGGSYIPTTRMGEEANATDSLTYKPLTSPPSGCEIQRACLVNRTFPLNWCSFTVSCCFDRREHALLPQQVSLSSHNLCVFLFSLNGRLGTCIAGT